MGPDGWLHDKYKRRVRLLDKPLRLRLLQVLATVTHAFATVAHATRAAESSAAERALEFQTEIRAANHSEHKEAKYIVAHAAHAAKSSAAERAQKKRRGAHRRGIKHYLEKTITTTPILLLKQCPSAPFVPREHRTKVC
jgi:hypothetical protein